ncbi:MAG: adenylate/guanylate cyclase domain-containing protein [Planctomycetaceae bacterium]
MYELIAQGPEPRQRLKMRLDSGRGYLIGRATDADVPVPWERFLSSAHIDLEINAEGMRLRARAGSQNPVFVDGEPRTNCRVAMGEQWVVGSTRFWVIEVGLDSTPGNQRQLQELTFTRQQLQQVRIADADRRMDVLARLPAVIGSVGEAGERDARLVNLLLTGIPQADVVAVIDEGADSQRLKLGAWERRLETAGAFRPSGRLVEDALHRDEGTLLHLWSSEEQRSAVYTQAPEADWAYCTPVGKRDGRRWGLYVAGRLPSETVSGVNRAVANRLQSDVKFTELVASIINSVIRTGSLEANVAVLRQFLSPPVVAALERSSDEGTLDIALLEPCECNVTVLFCDLRGFSQRAEEQAHNLRGLLERVSGALEIMTSNVTAFGGVTGDFLGDATLGFWGWPFPSEEAPLNACRSALAIRATFDMLRADPSHPLHDFEVGVGIAHGRAVAGKIGTQDRMTVSVFGPVVNLASRLEGLTRQLRVPILLDEQTAGIVRERLSETEGRTRRLARLLPYGVETPLTVSELLPPESEFPQLTSQHLRQYEEGLDQFIAGNWDAAHASLHAMPAADRAPDFLMLRIAQSHRRSTQLGRDHPHARQVTLHRRQATPAGELTDRLVEMAA